MEIPDLFWVLNMISHELWAPRMSEISCSTREINLVFPSTHVFFCLLYKQNSVKNNQTSVARRFTTNDIFTVTHKNIVFLRVFKYDFSQWPKTLYNTYVYIIKHNYIWCIIFLYNYVFIEEKYGVLYSTGMKFKIFSSFKRDIGLLNLVSNACISKPVSQIR
jgi:hypothetical protein